MNVMLRDKTTLKTYDAMYGDSTVFDDMTTAGVQETRDERIVRALLDAIDLVKARRGADPNGWRWGFEHTLRFTSLVSAWTTLSIPAATDLKYPKGFPRGGDGFNVDVSEYRARPASYDAVSFSYSHGPTQRLVVDLDPAGPLARNALPGGNVWDSNSPYFKNDAELWIRNENRRVDFAREHIVEDAAERIQYRSPE
jgi:penicillin amidase